MLYKPEQGCMWDPTVLWHNGKYWLVSMYKTGITEPDDYMWLASSADGMIVKGVKMAASFVPVVGGALGEAYTSVAASISLLKSTVGIYAIIALALTCIPCAVRSSIAASN